MASIMREEEEIKRAISDQLTFIANSCDLFDKGCRAEAIRISAAINILLESRKKESKGLLRRQDYPFKILSTVPDSTDMNIDRLIVSIKENFHEAEKDFEKFKSTMKINEKFMLTFILELKAWYLFTFDCHGTEISCPLKELKKHTIFKNDKNGNLTIMNWINSCSDKYHNISDEGKIGIIKNLNFLLYQNKCIYLPDEYSPMLMYIIGSKVHRPSDWFDKKYIGIDQWYDETIFITTDESKERYILTRKLLIESARDKDGGGHFDKQLSNDGYYNSKKMRELPMIIDGEPMTIEHSNLIMLRQLGYEILNSPSIAQYLNKVNAKKT